MTEFISRAAAAGYATARPAIHAEVLALVGADVPGPLARGADVGCGAGASTRPLAALVDHCVALDPSQEMIRAAAASVPGVAFLLGSAEHLPLATDSMNLITAAGSLDYADFDAFSREAQRVLISDGVVAVYDFFRGRRMRGAPELEDWYDQYLTRCGQHVSHSDLVGSFVRSPGLRLDEHRPFVIGVPMDLPAYVSYVMSDASDPTELGLRRWCEHSLAPLFDSTEIIEFDGYLAYLTPR